jgi:hypothetical protein
VSEELPTNDQPFVPPPPPTLGNPMFPPDELARKAAFVAAEARTALILSIIGLFCFGFIFGLIAYRKANEVLKTITVYEVGQEKRSLAMTAKVLSIIDIVGWIIALVARIALR